MKRHYTIVIQWSDEDRCFVVSLPEWGEFCHTHGDTYEEALKNATEVLAHYPSSKTKPAGVQGRSQEIQFWQQVQQACRCFAAVHPSQRC